MQSRVNAVRFNFVHGALGPTEANLSLANGISSWLISPGFFAPEAAVAWRPWPITPCAFGKANGFGVSTWSSHQADH